MTTPFHDVSSKRRAAPLRQAIRLAAVVLTGSMLGGCLVVGPDYETPGVSVPARWSNGGTRSLAPDTLSQWWQRFHDPILTSLIEDAVAGNLDVAAAKARVREARASRQQAIGTLLPNVTGAGSAIRSDVGTPHTEEVSNIQAGFDASWELDIFGANRRNVEAAHRGVEIAEASLRDVLLTLVGDVGAYYVEARGYQARIALARRTAASQRQTASLTESKFQAGAVSKVDVAKAAAEASSTAANIPTYEAAYAAALHRLSVLTGREPNALAARMQQRAGRIPSPRLPLPTGIPADVLLSRPDVRVAERTLAQATANIGAAEAARYPAVSLTGAIATSGSRIGDLAKKSSISWSFGPTLTVPIFNGGQLKAAVDVAKAQRDQYFIAYRATVLTALEDVENAIVSLTQGRRKVGQLATATRHYRDATQLSRTLYQTGSSSFLDVLDAERSLYSSEDSLLQSRVAVATSYISLAKALGGGWDGVIDSSRPEVVDVNTGPHFPPQAKPVAEKAPE